MSRRGARATVFLRRLLKLLAMVLTAGAIGFALGAGLSSLSQENSPTAPVADAGSAAPPATSSTVPAAASSAATPAATAPPTQTTAGQDDSPTPLAQVSVSVVDARLHTDETPSGRQAQHARVTVRVRAENAGDDRVTLPRPILRVGSVRVPAADAGAPGTRFGPLPAGTSQTVTLRFALAGEATPKVVRDRRARILIAGRSVPLRVALRTPTR